MVSGRDCPQCDEEGKPPDEGGSEVSDNRHLFGKRAEAVVRKNIDWDGLLTLGLTLLVTIGSAGVVLLPMLWVTYRTALHCPTRAPRDAIALVFGKRLRHGEPDTEYKQRLEKAVVLMRENSARSTMLLGGLSGDGIPSEAQAGWSYLQRLSPPPGSEILLEDQSRDTLQNLRNARRFLEKKNCPQTVLLSSCYHLARCSLIAKNLRIPHALCAVDAPFRLTLYSAYRLLVESFYMTWFYTGKHWATLTGNKRMLARIS